MKLGCERGPRDIWVGWGAHAPTSIQAFRMWLNEYGYGMRTYEWFYEVKQRVAGKS